MRFLESLGLRVWRWVDRRYRHPDLRQETWLRLFGGRRLFQPYGTTAPDRYPDVFQALRDLLADRPNSRLLSFGCSTGEEVFSLRQYLPTATIKGLDINRARIATCRAALQQRGGDAGLFFDTAADTRHEAGESYDAVLAMAVFRHGRLNKGPQECGRWLRFTDFSRSVNDLSRIIKPGGFLVIRHANFRFSDSPAARHFDLVQSLGNDDPAPVSPVYGPDDRRLADDRRDDGIYQKQGQFSQ